MDKDILLVRLPKAEGIQESFYGIGYYSDSGFIFVLLTKDLMNKFPSRIWHFDDNKHYVSENEIEILGTIKCLPPFKRTMKSKRSEEEERLNEV